MSSSASSSPLQDLSAALERVVAGASQSVVAVHSHQLRSSGFVWRSGFIVTADEALADDGEIVVILPGGQTATATLVGRDPTTDVALLRLDGAELQPIKLEQPPVMAGTLSVAVGSQQGAPTAALGVVAFAGEAWRSLRGGEIDRRIELDVALRREAEGGLALDAAGRIFGMTVFGPRRRVLVIPSATIERVAAKLGTRGRIARGYLGLGLQPVRLDSDAGVGAMVMSVDPRGPGIAAGIQQGDVITAWDGQPIQSVQILLRALGPDSVGSAVALSLRRAGQPVEVRLIIGERPQA